MGCILVSIPACEHEPFAVVPDPTDTIPTDTSMECHPDTVYFVKDVLPIVLSSCGMALCHDAFTKQNGYDFTSYETILATGLITAFNPEDSEFYKKMTETDPSKVMPPSPRGPISAENIAVIRKWIEQGARKNDCVRDTTCTIPMPVSFAMHVFPVIDKYCKGCHSGADPWAGLRLRNYPEVRSIALNGLLLGVIRHEQGFPPMPQTIEKLDQCIINIITQWISNGAPNN